jgi:hypothetical protein
MKDRAVFDDRTFSAEWLTGDEAEGPMALAALTEADKGGRERRSLGSPVAGRAVFGYGLQRRTLIP